MQAVGFHEHGDIGGPELRGVPVPTYESDEVLVDVVYNTVGDDTWVKSMRCLRNGGKLVVSGATAGHDSASEITSHHSVNSMFPPS